MALQPIFALPPFFKTPKWVFKKIKSAIKWVAKPGVSTPALLGGVNIIVPRH